MNVLYIAYQSRMYGANRSLLNLILDMRSRHGVIPYVLVAEDGDFVSECNKENIPCEVAFFYRWNNPGGTFQSMLKSRVKNIFNIYLYKKALEKTKDWKIDLVHSNSSETDIGCYIAQKYNIPHVWHIREYGMEDYNLVYSHCDNYVSKQYEKASAVITISKAIYNYYISERKLLSQLNTKTIYNGIAIIPTYHKSYFLNNTMNFCVCGLITEGKNQIEIIEALKYLKEYNFIVHFIGGGNEYYIRKLKEKTEELDVENKVKFWGYQSNVNDILKEMDIGIIPSKKEAFGRVTIEYMLNYMPVIGSNSGGTPELVAEGTGMVYELGKADELANRMKYFLEHKENVSCMGARARNHAIDNFSMKKNTDLIYDVYTSSIII